MILGKIIGEITSYLLSTVIVFIEGFPKMVARVFVRGVLYGFFMSVLVTVLWNIAFPYYQINPLQGWAIIIVVSILTSNM